VTFFIDANVVIYSAVDSPYREACFAVMSAVVDGAPGRTSTAALEEVWHAEISGKGGSITGLARYAYGVFTPLLPVTDEAFDRALGLELGRLGSNDRLHAATCLVNDIDVIVSADRGFDEVKGIRRVDPLDDRARRRLLT